MSCDHRYTEEQQISSVYFDITPCYRGHDHIRRFQVAFPGEFRDAYDADPVGVTRAVYDTLWMDLGPISKLRVQHLMVSPGG